MSIDSTEIIKIQVAVETETRTLTDYAAFGIGNKFICAYNISEGHNADWDADPDHASIIAMLEAYTRESNPAVLYYQRLSDDGDVLGVVAPEWVHEKDYLYQHKYGGAEILESITADIEHVESLAGWLSPTPFATGLVKAGLEEDNPAASNIGEHLTPNDDPLGGVGNTLLFDDGVPQGLSGSIPFLDNAGDSLFLACSARQSLSGDRILWSAPDFNIKLNSAAGTLKVSHSDLELTFNFASIALGTTAQSFVLFERTDTGYKVKASLGLSDFTENSIATDASFGGLINLGVGWQVSPTAKANGFAGRIWDAVVAQPSNKLTSEQLEFLISDVDYSDRSQLYTAARILNSPLYSLGIFYPKGTYWAPPGVTGNTVIVRNIVEPFPVMNLRRLIVRGSLFPTDSSKHRVDLQLEKPDDKLLIKLNDEGLSSVDDILDTHIAQWLSDARVISILLNQDTLQTQIMQGVPFHNHYPFAGTNTLYQLFLISTTEMQQADKLFAITTVNSLPSDFRRSIQFGVEY